MQLTVNAAEPLAGPCRPDHTDGAPAQRHLPVAPT
jgi:hypothetical protein